MLQGKVRLCNRCRPSQQWKGVCTTKQTDATGGETHGKKAQTLVHYEPHNHDHPLSNGALMFVEFSEEEDEDVQEDQDE